MNIVVGICAAGPSREHVQRGNIKRPRDDSPSSRTPKIQRSNSAAPKEGLQIDGDVAYRLKQKGVEGEWIQCTITSIIGEGNKRRYVMEGRDGISPPPPLTLLDTRSKTPNRMRLEDMESTRHKQRS